MAFSFSLQPQQQQQNQSGTTGTGLFGQQQPQQQTTNTSFSFGQQPQQQTTSGGLFGQQTQQQQTTTGGLFGQQSNTGGLFGQQKQPATGNLFGQPQQQPLQGTTSLFGQQPASNSLFGQPQQQSTTTGSLFGQPQQQASATTSLFGQPQQQQQTTTTSLFGQPQQQSNSLFGQQQQPLKSSLFGQSTQQQQPTSTTNQQNPLLNDLSALFTAYDPASQTYRFIHPFYNLNSSTAPPPAPPNVPAGLYQQAVNASPNPKCMHPVFAFGIEDLQKRMEHQREQSELIKTRAEEIEKVLNQLEGKSLVDISGRVERCKQRGFEIGKKLIHLMKMLQLLRAKGVPVLKDTEEEMFRQYESLQKLLNKYGLADRIENCKSKLNLIQNNQRINSQQEQYVVNDQEAFNQLSKVLEEMQKGLEKLTSTILLDFEIVNQNINDKENLKMNGLSSFIK